MTGMSKEEINPFKMHDHKQTREQKLGNAYDER